MSNLITNNESPAVDHTFLASLAGVPFDDEVVAFPAPPKYPPNPVNGFHRLNSAVERWFFQPDIQAIRIVLGAAKAHYLNLGDPAWLFVIAPPGSGKTTMTIMGASELPSVIQIGDISENTFLSGFYGKKDPGMLERLGSGVADEAGAITCTGNALFLIKDFTTVLAMRREKRSAILGQLREIHDGKFTRSFGTGETKTWKGRVSILAAVTPALDRHYSVFSTLGERFLQLRLARPSSEEAGEWAVEQQGHEEEIQSELTEGVGKVFSQSSEKAPSLSMPALKRVAAVAELIAVGRTYVERSGYGRGQIEYVSEPEANTRISKGLAAIAKGIAALHGRTEVQDTDLQDVFRVALDCLPESRRTILCNAIRGEEDAKSKRLHHAIRTRTVEDLGALGLLNEDGATPLLSAAPVLSDRARELLEATQLNLSL